jgi:transglutaminase-like putative cysteine protease
MVRSDASAGRKGRPSVERFFQFSLLGLVASGYLAVAGSGYLDTPTIALTAAGLLLRGLVIGERVRLDVSDRVVTLITLGYIGFFPLDYFLLSREFLAATVHLVFFLAVMKILTAKTNRDYSYTAAIALAELLAAALLSIEINVLPFLALYLLFAMAALTSGEIRRSTRQAAATARSGMKRFYPRLALHSVMLTLGILSLSAGLFFLLPRTAEAAFSRLISHRFHLPGFSSQLTLGEIGEIKTASRPIMHIRIFSSETPGGLKWRGGALAEFDGKRWSESGRPNQTVPVENGHADLEPSVDRRPGRHINYHVDLDVFGADALFFAGVPEMVDLRYAFLLRTATGSYRIGRPSPRGVHYDAYSRLEDMPETSPAPYPTPILPLPARNDCLQLPPLDSRIPALARAMMAGAATDLERARAIERRLRADYGYTLELPDHEVADPLAYFLFTRQKGHCEYFASAMTVMLRTAGIPARLATGFQSGVYNPITDFWLVRASDAHAWVEAWIPGHGWTTFDPTPPDPNRRSFALLTKLGLYLDAAGTFWQEWVVNYDISRQGTLADRLELGARSLGIRWFDSLSGLDWSWHLRVAAWFRRYGVRILMVLALGVAIWVLGPRLVRLLRIRSRVERVRRGQATVGDATLLYERMLDLLKRRGYEKPAWFTPTEFARSLPPGRMGTAVTEFTVKYNALRFGRRTGVAPRLSMLLDELEGQ